MTQNNQQLESVELDLKAQEKLKQIVIARIQTLSDETRVSLGSEEFSPSQLVNHVEDGDDVGLEIINMHWRYLKDLASGALYDYE